MEEDIRAYINEGAEARKAINVENIEVLGGRLYSAIKSGHKLITFGNGGSAADAQHMAAELTGRFSFERKSLPAIALTTNTSALTAIGNDYSYDEVFSRQVDGLVEKGDFVVGISTSGNSQNVINALDAARSKGAFTLALTGKKGGKIKDHADSVIRVESETTPIIQEVHVAVIHLICLVLDKRLKKDTVDG